MCVEKNYLVDFPSETVLSISESALEMSTYIAEKVDMWVVGQMIIERPDDHAGEMETSILMAVRPDLVRRRSDGSLDADDGEVRSTSFEAVEKGWVSITRPWHLLTTNTGAGNPHAATAEKGETLLESLEERFGSFLVELAKGEPGSSFPFPDE